MLALEERSVMTLAEESENAYRTTRDNSPEKLLFREEAPRQRRFCKSSKKLSCLQRLREVSLGPRPAALQSPYISNSRPVLKSQSGYHLTAIRDIAAMMSKTPLSHTKENDRYWPSNSTLNLDLPSLRHKSLLEKSVLENQHRSTGKQRTWTKLTIRIKRKSPEEKSELPVLGKLHALQGFKDLSPIKPGRKALQ